MDKIGLERDEYNGEGFPIFQDQSPGSHAKRRILIPNRKMVKKRLHSIWECIIQSFMSTIRTNLIYSVQQHSFIREDDSMKRMGGGNSEPVFLQLSNSCPY